MSKPRLLALGMLTVAFVGCSSARYAYVPAASPGPTGGEIASLYRVPSDRPRGDVEVTSFGVEHPHGVAALRVRIVVSNNDDQPWSIDTRQQFADIPGVGRVTPLFVTVPYVRVEPGKQAVIDLFFRLPPGVDEENEIRDFALAWQLQAGSSLVERRTLFQRYPLLRPWEVGSRGSSARG